MRQQRGYGNVDEKRWVDFIVESLEPVVKNLVPGGSLVLNISNDIFESKRPSRSLYVERMVLALHDDLGLSLMDRWPANLIHDGSPEVVRHFPDTAGQQGDIVGHNKERESPNGTFGKFGPARDFEARQDAEKSAARFFYCAKASTSERNEGMDHMPDAVLARSCLAQTNAAKGITSEKAGGSFNVARITKNNHPTVKPVELMAYLCRLVTPPNGTVFDPFAGSGSTGVAALRENFNFVGCEQSLDYVAIARARIEYELNKPKQGALFGDEFGLCPDAANL